MEPITPGFRAFHNRCISVQPWNIAHSSNTRLRAAPTQITTCRARRAKRTQSGRWKSPGHQEGLAQCGFRAHSPRKNPTKKTSCSIAAGIHDSAGKDQAATPRPVAAGSAKPNKPQASPQGEATLTRRSEETGKTQISRVKPQGHSVKLSFASCQVAPRPSEKIRLPIPRAEPQVVPLKVGREATGFHTATALRQTRSQGITQACAPRISISQE